jgi:cell division protein FtsZ
VNVTGGNDMSVSEAERVAEMVQGRISNNARIIWGAAIDPSLEHKLRVMLILTGVRSKQILGPGEHLRGHEVGVDVVR